MKRKGDKVPYLEDTLDEDNDDDTGAFVGGEQGDGMSVLLKSKDATISALRLQMAAEERKRKALEEQIAALENRACSQD